MTRTVAVLGAGIGREHVDGYLALPDRFKVRTICGLEPDQTAALAARCGAQTTDSIEQVLADPAIEVADICLPPVLHVSTAKAALEAGKHVIVEKPIAGSLAEADALRDLARKAGKNVFPVFQYRYGTAFATLDRLRAAGLLGEPMVATLETHWNRDAAYYAPAWRGAWAGELGGVVISHAIHIHDLICHLFGPVSEVSGFTATRVNEIETEDCAALSFRMQNGALVTSSITLGAASDESRMRLVFSKATVESAREPYRPGEGTWRIRARNPDDQKAIDRVAAETPSPAHLGFAGFLAGIADALDGRGQAVSVADGVFSLELASAIYQAARSGTRVSLPLDRSLSICQGFAR